MRIVQIGSFPLDSHLIKGGVESSVFGLANELSTRHSVIIIDTPRLDIADRVEKQDNLTIYRFQNKGLHHKDAVRRVDEIISVIKDLNPSICHLHGTSIFNWRMLKSLRSECIPVCLTVHGLVFIEKKKSLKHQFSFKGLYQLVSQSIAERRLLSSVSSIIVDTEYVADVIRHYGLRSCPQIRVIPQGINEVFFDLNCSKRSKEILSVGAISKRKGHLFLIQAFEKLCESVDGMHLTICGSLSETDEYERLQNLIRVSPYRHQISVLSGVPKQELLSLYQNAHIFALHSQEESQGIVLAEAMAAGLPVVATNVGGIPYVIKNNMTGLLSNYGDTSFFAKSLETLMTQRDLWEKMSDRCRLAASAYSWKHISDLIVEQYLSIIAKYIK